MKRLSQFLTLYSNSSIAVVAMGMFLLLLIIALLAPLISPQNPYDLAQLNLLDGRLPPMTRGSDAMLYLLGTDDQGRDVLSAILYGLRISIGIAFLSGAIAVAIGASAGMIAAYAGGTLDAIVMRIVDIQLSFPSILIALILLAVFGPGLDKVVIALVMVQWAYYARTVRSAAQTEIARDYIEAARCLELGAIRIMFRHVLPNCSAPLFVVVTVEVASAIALEAALSFLGAGVPVTEPSLGLLIANGYSFVLSGDYWLSLYPGAVLFILVASVNLVGDRLRTILNPRHTN
ncbi:ABC transporter permease [Ochrobactrum vermis]|uniref:ABC transporter permease n=1 Tax=Ochrobactrum vermis TaxID=1827297 RepID=A0ABU8PFU9_9HYPH|nr:ABC transporter permease [Ochrobactrum vermis]